MRKLSMISRKLNLAQSTQIPGREKDVNSVAQVRPEPETSQSEHPLHSISSLQELQGHGSKRGDATDLRTERSAGAPVESTWSRNISSENELISDRL